MPSMRWPSRRMGLTLASGSAKYDTTIKLWDMNASDAAYGTCLNTLTGHTDAVCVRWSYAPDPGTDAGLRQ